jgi:hypothetical protein
MLFDPAVQPARLLLLLLRQLLGRPHQGLDALDHRVEKGNDAPDEGPAQDGVPLLDEPELLHLGDQ